MSKKISNSDSDKETRITIKIDKGKKKNISIIYVCKDK